MTLVKSSVYLVLIFSLCDSSPVVKRSNTLSHEDAERYLMKYGYLKLLPEPRLSSDIQQHKIKKTEKKKSAILLFQQFNHLPETGKLDEGTLNKMAEPRCGISDLHALERDEALNIWSAVIPMDFTEVQSDSPDANIHVKFVSGGHDDPYPFDGLGKVLAHAFYPKDGRLHFDDDEHWAYNDRKKLDQGDTDFVAVATHELGHALGLSHSKNQDAIMIPYYRTPPETGVKLGDDDIRRIQQLYGARAGVRVLGTTPVSEPPSSTIGGAPEQPEEPEDPDQPRQPQRPQPTPYRPRPRGSPPDGRCPDAVDGATTAMNSQTYFFHGNLVWRLDASGNVMSPDYVDQIFAADLSSDPIVAVTSRHSQMTILFQGRNVFGFQWNVQTKQFILQNDFPKQLTEEVRFEPTSAFRWTDGNLVLVNGDDFVTYDDYWNKVTFTNKLSNYFHRLSTPSSAKIFNDQSNIVVLTGSKYYETSLAMFWCVSLLLIILHLF